MKLGKMMLMGAILGGVPLVGLGQETPTQPAGEGSDIQHLAKLGLSKNSIAVVRGLATVKAQYDLYKKMVDENAMHVAKLNGDIRQRTGLLASSGLLPLVSELQLQRETLQQEEAAAVGRRAGLEATIAEWTERAKARMVDDATIKEFEAVVNQEQQRLERNRKLREVNSISAGEFEDSVTGLAVAQARVAAARQRAATPANEAIDAWNRELLNLNVAEKERAARLKYIGVRLATFEPALDDIRELDSATADLHAAEQNLRVAREHVQEGEAFFPN